jgi:pimeloyl-ACP methyl ester carboxylesterase
VTAPYSLWTNEEPRLHLAAWDGEGPPVLLVHGMGAHAGWWGEVGSRLAEKARPVALDLSGHGDSGWRDDGHYSGVVWSSDIEDARHALGWDRFLLCGHSLGARVALEYAAAHPERLSALALVDFLPEFRGTRFSRARSHPQPFYGSEEEVVRRFRLQPDGTVLRGEALEALGRGSVKKTGLGWTWKYDWRAFKYRYEPVWQTLGRVRAPTLVVRGEHSRVMSAEDMQRVAAGVRGARALELAGAHHHVPLDAPDALADALAELL